MTSNLILIDTSYNSFYRFFATIRWFSFAFPDEYKIFKIDKTYNWINNSIFIEKYEKMFLNSIIKIIGKKIFDNSDIIFCIDSPRTSLWRNNIECKYKKERIDLSLKYNFKPVFEYTYNTIIPNYVKNNKNIYHLNVNELEADDIIAIITMYMKNINPNKPIYIVSGDKDFLQLGRNNVFFVNLKKMFSLTEEEAIESLNNKILFGDNSDCISGIFPKGKKINKKELLESNDKLMEYLNNNENIKNKYYINRQIIDFNYIPKKYFNKVVKMFKSLYI
jgi:5'-3' exonuclease